MKKEDFLVEIQTEELPPKSLLKLGKAFCKEIEERLQKSDLAFADITFFATPRRLAVWVKDLVSMQRDQTIERKGPTLSLAFDVKGNPSPACVGFARSCGVLPADLTTIKNEQGEWVGYRQKVAGKTVNELLPTIVAEAVLSLPVPKRMRWGDGEALFVRPVHSVIMLYGADVIDATILGCHTNRLTSGHLFHAPNTVSITDASSYAAYLATKAYVIPDFEKRREMIRDKAIQCVKKKLQGYGQVYISSEALLDEITGLVEWPVALCGQFDKVFLNLPEEVLISSMQDHQRYFPVVDEKFHLLPYFVTISNIESENSSRVIHGNERVLRARLSDAAFFYETDKNESLDARIERLKGIIFQAKLGTLHDKALRMSHLAVFIAKKMGAEVDHAKRAGWLAKTDLTTNMVGEFPELQGVMGYYYALHDKESDEVAFAIREHYMPRFAGDELPTHVMGQLLALTDRIDTLTGTFGIAQIPTGDKDPFGLRRAALGIIRILIEKNINLDLKEIVEFAFSNYSHPLANIETVDQVLTFIQERLRTWYLDQGVSSDIFAAVVALGINNPLDVHKRIKAVQTFKKLNEADALSVANKRVSNILAKYTDIIHAKAIDPKLFEVKAENELADQLAVKSQLVKELSQSDQYEEVLLQLAELRQPIDDFFDQVMVMTDDQSRRENRILLLKQLRQLFLNVADIALLQ